MNYFRTWWYKWRSTVGLSVLGVVIVSFIFGMGWLFFERGQSFLGEEQKLRLRSMATIAASGFDVDDIAQIHVASDYTKPAYKKLVHKLISMRDANKDIRFAYIFRPTPDPKFFEFVADADSLDPYAVIDLNKDGVVDESDELAPPGTPYDISETPELAEALSAPSTTYEPYSDQWGTYMAGFAPIMDNNGITVAVVGIDIDIARYIDLSQRIFSPPLFALLLLGAVTLVIFLISFLGKRKADVLHSLNRQRAKLLLVTFHQLGTPLTLVRWATDSLKEMLPSITNPSIVTFFKRDIEILTEAGNRFEALLQVLRKADKIQAGKSEYNAIEADLFVTVQNCINKLKFILDTRQQSVQVNIKSPFICRFDPEQIDVIITELLTNASRYSPMKSLITVSAVSAFKNVQVSVQDQGAGIDAVDAEHMFEEFSRGKKATEYHPDGYGLGLYINKGIINNAGGRIWVENNHGKGATFHFTLLQ